MADERPRAAPAADSAPDTDAAGVPSDARGAGSPLTPAVAWLHLGDEAIVVARSQNDAPDTVRRLELGTNRIARDCFHHDPPTPGEIERAIDVVEDEIMRLGRPDDVTTPLFSRSPALQPWAAVSGPTMTIEIVEQWFQRLASASLGLPGALQGLPSGREAAATLLVLREFMHHRGHASIVVVDPGGPLAG